MGLELRIGSKEAEVKIGPIWSSLPSKLEHPPLGPPHSAEQSP